MTTQAPVETEKERGRGVTVGRRNLKSTRSRNVRQQEGNRLQFPVPSAGKSNSTPDGFLKPDHNLESQQHRPKLLQQGRSPVSIWCWTAPAPCPSKRHGNKSKDTCPNDRKSPGRGPNQQAVLRQQEVSLQEAVFYLMDTLNKSDPPTTITAIRNRSWFALVPSPITTCLRGARQLSWGTSSARLYVNAIPQYPTGGTNAAVALNTAFTALKAAIPTRREISTKR